MAKVRKDLPPEVYQLEELVGGFIEYWGFKRIHGRIWAHLYLSKTPLDSAELMDRLAVSKGLMSIAVRDLLEHDVIEPAKTGKYGTTYYQANKNLMQVITKVLRKREAVMINSTRSCLERMVKFNKEQLETAGIDFERVKGVLELTMSAESLLNVFLMQEMAKEQVDTLPGGAALFSGLLPQGQHNTLK